MLTFIRLWRQYRHYGMSARRAADAAWQVMRATWSTDAYLRELHRATRLGLREPRRGRTGAPLEPRT